MSLDIEPKKKKRVERRMELSPELKELATAVIAEERIDLRGAKVEFLMVYPNISKTVAGRCIKANKELNFFSNADYVIEISQELYDALNEKQRKILMFHELLHILVKSKDDGNVDFKILDHDVKDFYAIISKYGIDWFKELKLINASLYDLEPTDEDRFKL